MGLLWVPCSALLGESNSPCFHTFQAWGLRGEGHTLGHSLPPAQTVPILEASSGYSTHKLPPSLPYGFLPPDERGMRRSQTHGSPCSPARCCAGGHVCSETRRIPNPRCRGPTWWGGWRETGLFPTDRYFKTSGFKMASLRLLHAFEMKTEALNLDHHELLPQFPSPVLSFAPLSLKPWKLPHCSFRSVKAPRHLSPSAPPMSSSAMDTLPSPGQLLPSLF